jgi:methionyl aminopeptidase
MATQNKDGILIHTPEEFEGMRKAGRLAAEILDRITPYVKPDISTLEINNLCHDWIVQAGAIPAPLGYRGYPKSVCTSVNHVVCHGIPDERKLKDGDIVNIDVTVIVDGWHGDTSRMFYVGDKVSIKAQRLVQTTYECTMRGIEEVRPGAHLGDIGAAIQECAEKFGYGVVRDYCGHGLGRIFHTAPNVVHYGKRNTGIVLQEGMFFTIEPMINAGKHDTILSKADGWTVTTRDKSLSAQFEHSLAVTKDGYEIFTSSPKGLTLPPYVV